MKKQILVTFEFDIKKPSQFLSEILEDFALTQITEQKLNNFFKGSFIYYSDTCEEQEIKGKWELKYI
ncbi:hypothetical protein V9L05_15280 [Bernardetia sp. Wsw4-3y2]|uniref:hypothetical protein n=1 Tax=Bernardetia sp. Wsw4-3y2 TaxID=3127471 RepID=UPI0030D27920